ncbi:trichohyalin isoform X2 [Leptidea sinapis]|uniref:trichohyalin isoform X2 n=1 Tax=Leptidea sinapis TaxID=189913 RepID=UPI0021C4BB17|nr:trichohyalin isoform X2 [Leptidea sinapis]
MNESDSKKINFNKSTLFSLKAELLKKQEEVKGKKNLPQHKIDNFKPSIKTTDGNQSEFKKEKRSLRDNLKAVDTDELEACRKSKLALEKKAQLYDHLSDAVGDSKLESQFLVDFKEKKQQDTSTAETNHTEDNETVSTTHDEGDDGEWVQFTDCLGRTRKCLKSDLDLYKKRDEELLKAMPRKQGSVDDTEPQITEQPEKTILVQKTNDYLQSLRDKWEEKEKELLAKDKDIHYQDLLFDEARMHGIGYYSFSTDETERQKQMAELMKRRQETLQAQREAEEIRKKRDELVAARVAAARARQRMRAGLPSEDAEDRKDAFLESLLEFLHEKRNEADAKAKEEERKRKEELEKERQKITEQPEKTILVQKTNDYLQSLRDKWEEKEKELLAKVKDIHYQDLLFDEARKTERQKQMAELMKRRQETLQAQREAEEIRKKRDKLVAARVAAARARQRMRAGLPSEDAEGRKEAFLESLLEFLHEMRKEADAKAKEEERKRKEELEKERQKITEQPEKTILVQKTNDYLQSLRDKWEEKEKELLAKVKDIHYQDLLFDEARKTERQKQMAELMKRRQETLQAQREAEEIRKKRDELVAARVAAARARQRMRAGLPSEDAEDRKDAFLESQLEFLHEKRNEADAKAKEEERKRKEELEKERQKVRDSYIREWDLGKEGVEGDIKNFKEMTQEEYVEQQRSKRIEEFAPPTMNDSLAKRSEYLFDAHGSKIHSEKPKTWSEVRHVTPPAPIISDQNDDGAKGLFFSSKKCEQTVTYKNFINTEDTTPIENELSEDEDIHCDGLKNRKRNATHTEIAPPPTIEYYGPNPKHRKAEIPFESDIRESYAKGTKSLESKSSGIHLPKHYDFTFD